MCEIEHVSMYGFDFAVAAADAFGLRYLVVQLGDCRNSG